MTTPTLITRGNLTFDPTSGKGYTYYPSNNQLWTVSSPWTALGYDALGRLAAIDSSVDTNFAYDGLDMIAEYDPSGAIQARYVHGPGMDQPLVRYDGAGTNNKTSLHADERGSIAALSYGSPYAPAINRYDEFGKPQSSNVGRFQYTGQMWLPEAGMYYYKARMYHPGLGRFPQTDPIGYEDGANLYAYVLNDPVNLVDPLGLGAEDDAFCNANPGACVWVFGTRPGNAVAGGSGSFSGNSLRRERRPSDQTGARAPQTVRCATNVGQDMMRDVANFSDALAAGAGVAAAVSAPSGAGPLIFGSLALAAKITSLGANTIVAADQYLRGDTVGMKGTMAGMAAGALAPLGAFSAMRKIGHSAVGPSAQWAMAEGFSWPASGAAELVVSGCSR